jgi:hypothetical protein
MAMRKLGYDWRFGGDFTANGDVRDPVEEAELFITELRDDYATRRPTDLDEANQQLDQASDIMGALLFEVNGLKDLELSERTRANATLKEAVIMLNSRLHTHRKYPWGQE